MKARRPMRWAWVLAILGVASIAIASTLERGGAPDPEFQGEPLGYYLDKDLKIFGPVDETPRHQLVSALGALDNQALPALLRRLRARDPLLRSAMNRLASSPIPTPWKARPYSEAWEERKLALRAIYFMGPRASGLSGEIAKLLTDKEFSREAGLTLARLGEPGLRLALEKMHDPRPWVRANAVLAVARANGRLDAAEVNRALERRSKETDPSVLAEMAALRKRLDRARGLDRFRGK